MSGVDGEPLIVEVREGSEGGDVSWWIARRGQPTVDEGSVETFLQLEVDEGPAAVGQVRQRLDEYRAKCERLSESAYDKLAASKALSRFELSESSRKRHVIIPNADLTFGIVITSKIYVKALVDLETGAAVSLPKDMRLYEVASWSGDSSRVACWVCPSLSDEAGQRVVVIDPKLGMVTNDIPIGRFVSDIAWSEDGTKLAVLCEKERLGSGPLESLGKAMGHGVPYDDFGVVFVDLKTGAMESIRVTEDVQYGKGLILWDARAVRGMVR